MRVDEWASIVASEVLNDVIGRKEHNIHDECAAQIADSIVRAIEKHWSLAPNQGEKHGD